VKASSAGQATRIALPVLSLLLLAAHFYRGGVYPLVVAAIALTGLACVARPWAGRVLGLVLLCGTIEWLRTAWIFAAVRASLNLPYARLVIILGSVSAVTLASAVVAWRSDVAGDRRKTD
jgi:hypothetical protein